MNSESKKLQTTLVKTTLDDLPKSQANRDPRVWALVHDARLAHEMLPELRFASEIMDFILSERGSDFELCSMAKNFKLRSAPFMGED